MNELGTDWRDESTYEYTKVLSKHRWAWEFLRRSPSYRAFWTDWNTNYRRLAGELAEAIKKRGSAGILRDLPTIPEAKPLLDLHDRCHRFGLSWAIDPADWHPNGAFRNRVDVPTIAVYGDVPTEDRLRGKQWPGYPNHLRMEFNLALPLEPQLRAASVEFEKHRRRAEAEVGLKLVKPPEGFKLRRSAFVLYLRILDADLGGASLTEIGRELFPDETQEKPRDQKRSASMAKKTAMKMAEEGYWVLLLQEEEQPYLGDDGEGAGKK